MLPAIVVILVNAARVPKATRLVTCALHLNEKAGVCVECHCLGDLSIRGEFEMESAVVEIFDERKDHGPLPLHDAISDFEFMDVDHLSLDDRPIAELRTL